LGGWDLKASDQVLFHRGWPGVGFTHSLLYGVVIAFLLWRFAGSKTWAISFLTTESTRSSGSCRRRTRRGR
jgi:hypothetical protein